MSYGGFRRHFYNYKFKPEIFFRPRFDVKKPNNYQQVFAFKKESKKYILSTRTIHRKLQTHSYLY